MLVEDVIKFVSLHIPMTYHSNEFPKNSNDDVGIVRLDGGSAPDPNIGAISSPSIQVLIRNKKGGEAERIANEVWRLFHDKQKYLIGDTLVHNSQCIQSVPVYVGQDNNGRTIYSVNVSCYVSEQPNL